MTKEEFEQLKSTVKQWLFHTGSLDPTNYANELMLKFIEPREKRIAELETTNKKISDECHKLVDSLEKKQNENVELIGKVAFLENDLNNAKARNEKLKCCQNCMHYRHYTKDVTECAMDFITAQNCRHNGFDKWRQKSE
jgi:chromosome segregation ATPase